MSGLLECFAESDGGSMQTIVLNLEDNQCNQAIWILR